MIGRIEVHGEIEEPILDEGKIKNPIAGKLYRSDEDIEKDLTEHMGKVVSVVMKQINIPGMQQARKNPLAIVVFVVPEEYFNLMGRPTVGDLLPVSVFTEKKTEIESPP
jgi:hypothetical protein